MSSLRGLDRVIPACFKTLALTPTWRQAAQLIARRLRNGNAAPRLVFHLGEIVGVVHAGEFLAEIDAFLDQDHPGEGSA